MKTFASTLTLLFFASFLCACSESIEEPAEPGSIKAQAEEIGHQAAQAIKSPMDKAQITVDQENDRIRKLEERINK